MRFFLSIDLIKKNIIEIHFISRVSLILNWIQNVSNIEMPYFLTMYRIEMKLNHQALSWQQIQLELIKLIKFAITETQKKMLKINWLHLIFAEAIQMAKTIQNWQFTHDRTHQSICSLEATQFVVSHFNSLVSGYWSAIVYCRCKKVWSTLFFPNAKYYVFDRNNKTAFCFLFSPVFIFIEKVKIHMQINGTFEKSCIIRCVEKTDKMVRK